MVVDVVSLIFYCLFFLVLSLIGIRGRGKWQQRGMVTGFIVALFTEMWGFPLSLFLVTTLGHSNSLPYQFDNLVYYFTQTRSASDLAFVNPPLAWLAEYTLARGLTLLALLPIINGWLYLRKNIKDGLVTKGPYSISRNPQYVGFVLFVIGMTLYWPTLITVPMGLLLCFAYYHLAISEEKYLSKTFGVEYQEYSHKTPKFLGRKSFRIFTLPKGLNFTERIVEVALLIPFILWFAECIPGIIFGTNIVRTYWFPIAYAFQVYIGVVISFILLIPVTLVTFVKWYLKKRKHPDIVPT
jgi:protein-S-isoprenylcysteine O-methyltransferase Ste14